MALENRVILVESHSGHRKLLNFNLDVYVGADVVFKRNADAAINFLKENSDIRLIISEEVVGQEQTILKIYYYVVSNNLNIPIILSGHCKKLVGKIEMYEKENWRKIIRKCANILGVTAKQMANKKVDKYYPIPANTLLAMTTAPVDVFVTDASNQMNVLFHKGKGIGQKDIRKHFLDHKSCLFVLSKERLKFAGSFSEQVFDFIANKNISVEERIKATGMAFDKVREVINVSGMSERAVQMAKTTVESIIQIAASSHGLSDLIDIFFDSEESYRYRHSLLIAIISHQVIGDMDWGNEQQKVKIAFAAFFHDITIAHEEYGRIHSQEEFDGHNIPEKDRENVLSHAFDAAKLIEGIPDIPYGVDTIIIQHHGALNGIGFKKEEQDPRLSTLATVFLMVEDYVDSLVDMGGENSTERLKKLYTKGNFAKVADAISRIGNS